MTVSDAEKIATLLRRSRKALATAGSNLALGDCEAAVSRAYYAAFYAAKAVLLAEGLKTSKHSGVSSLIHRYFVRTGKLDREHGALLDQLFDLRSVADYAFMQDVERDQAEQALTAAGTFIHATERFLSGGTTET